MRSTTSHWGRISAAVLAAPLAGLLVSVALPALIPASPSVRYLVAALAVVPAMAVAPCLALLAKSAARAWVVSAAAMAMAGVVLWRSFP